MAPLHVLYTPRLTLTLHDPSSLEDNDAVIALFNDPVVLEKQGDVGIRTREDMAGLTAACLVDHSKFIHLPPPCNITGDDAKSLTAYLIRLGSHAPDGPRIGSISLVQRGQNAIPDIGWMLFHEYAGHGYATEAAREALRYWKDDLGIQEIIVVTRVDNSGSYRIAEKLGFVKVERGMLDEDGVVKNLYILPGMKEPDPSVVDRFQGGTT